MITITLLLSLLCSHTWMQGGFVSPPGGTLAYNTATTIDITCPDEAAYVGSILYYFYEVPAPGGGTFQWFVPLRYTFLGQRASFTTPMGPSGPGPEFVRFYHLANHNGVGVWTITERNL